MNLVRISFISAIMHDTVHYCRNSYKRSIFLISIFLISIFLISIFLISIFFISIILIYIFFISFSVIFISRMNAFTIMQLVSETAFLRENSKFIQNPLCVGSPFWSKWRESGAKVAGKHQSRQESSTLSQAKRGKSRESGGKTPDQARILHIKPSNSCKSSGEVLKQVKILHTVQNSSHNCKQLTQTVNVV